MDTSDIDFTNRIGSGGTADVYAVNAHPDIVAKLYNQPHKINFDKLKVLSDRLSGEPFSAHLAIPDDLVSGPGGLVGFTQKYFDNTSFLELDYWIEGPLKKSLSPLQRGLHFRLTILRTLADIIAGLHSNNIAIVDLKPSNILVHRVTGQAAIVDCDAFCVLDASGNIEYPAHEVTVGYCNGDALRKGLPPTKLSYKQDSFAFAVIAFQILNNGIHPYQGIICADLKDHNLDSLIKGGVYPYGHIAPKEVSPLPISIHSTLPSILLDAFERSFEMKRKHLDIARWSTLFSNILEKNLVEECPNTGQTAIHWKFSGHPCSECTFEALTNKLSQKPQKPKRRTASTNSRISPNTKASAKQTQPRTSNQSIPPISSTQAAQPNGIYKWMFGLTAVIIMIVFLNDVVYFNSPKNTSVPVSSQPTYQSTGIKTMSPVAICRNAIAFTYDKWESRSLLLPFVNEAKARGYTIAYCREALGISSESNSNAGQPSPTEQSGSGTKEREKDYLKAFSVVNLCGAALDPSKTDWDARPAFANIISEAKRRGYTISSCRSVLGLTSSQPANETTFTKLPSCDIERSDVTLLKNTPLGECETKCRQNQSCKAFVYNKWNSLCILKSRTSPRIIDVSADCYVTGNGNKYDEPGNWIFKELSNRRFKNASISNIVDASSLEACRKACEDDDLCFGANFNRTEGRCELLNLIQSSSTPDDGYDALYVFTPR
jgi:serine/threonine protein kinase